MLLIRGATTLSHKIRPPKPVHFSTDTTPASPGTRPEPVIRATASPSTALNYPYLSSELKRIAIVSGIVVLALVGFSFI